PDYYARLEFRVIPRSDLTLTVAESDRRGAPATLVRAGEDRDVNDLVAMGQVRSAPYRLHLHRDRDLVTFAIAKKRLLAGLGAPGAREVHFFIAEEGASAVAYVLITAAGSTWTIEEAGDRDPSGARLGAILQVLIARDPAEQRPTISGRLPAGTMPPQLSIIGETPSRDVMMVRPLTAAGESARSLREENILYWRNDL